MDLLVAEAVLEFRSSLREAGDGANVGTIAGSRAGRVIPLVDDGRRHRVEAVGGRLSAELAGVMRRAPLR